VFGRLWAVPRTTQRGSVSGHGDPRADCLRRGLRLSCTTQPYSASRTESRPDRGTWRGTWKTRRSYTACRRLGDTTSGSAARVAESHSSPAFDLPPNLGGSCRIHGPKFPAAPVNKVSKPNTFHNSSRWRFSLKWLCTALHSNRRTGGCFDSNGLCTVTIELTVVLIQVRILHQNPMESTSGW
jgi:hypothetical protein